MRNSIGWIGALALALVAATGCHHAPASIKAPAVSASVQTAPPARAADARKLQPGDCLLVTFHRKSLPEPITERVIVNRTGNITLPLAGKVRVSGLTIEAAENVITGHYQPSPYGDKINLHTDSCD